MYVHSPIGRFMYPASPQLSLCPHINKCAILCHKFDTFLTWWFILGVTLTLRLREVENLSWKPEELLCGSQNCPSVPSVRNIAFHSRTEQRAFWLSAGSQYRSKWFNLYTSWQNIATALPSISVCSILHFSPQLFPIFDSPFWVSNSLSFQQIVPLYCCLN